MTRNNALEVIGTLLATGDFNWFQISFSDRRTVFVRVCGESAKLAAIYLAHRIANYDSYDISITTGENHKLLELITPELDFDLFYDFGNIENIIKEAPVECKDYVAELMKIELDTVVFGKSSLPMDYRQAAINGIVNKMLSE